MLECLCVNAILILNFSAKHSFCQVVIEIVPLPGEDASTREFLVHLVDIGDQVVIREDDIRELDAHFAELPVQVIYDLNVNSIDLV